MITIFYEHCIDNNGMPLVSPELGGTCCVTRYTQQPPRNGFRYLL